MKIRTRASDFAQRLPGRLRLVSSVAGLALLAACAGTGNSPTPGVPDQDANNPSTYPAVMRIADAARSSGDFPAAVGLYRRANALKPRDPEPLLKLGATLAQLHAYNESVAAYASALSLQPNSPDAERGLGNALVSLDQADQAILHLENALKLDPKDPRSYNSLGVVLDMTGEHRAAQKRYREGLAISPGNLAIGNNLGLSLALSGDFDQAVAVLRPLALHPSATARTRQNLALVYGLAGDLEAAARVARVDLDEAAVQHNLAYYSTLRSLADKARTAAIRAQAAGSEANGTTVAGQ